MENNMTLEVWSIRGKEQTRKTCAQMATNSIICLDKTPVYHYCEGLKKFHTFHQHSITIWF